MKIFVCSYFFQDRIKEFSQFNSLAKASGTYKYSTIFHIENFSVGGGEGEGEGKVKYKPKLRGEKRN